jgi:hypothetical protein
MAAIVFTLPRDDDRLRAEVEQGRDRGAHLLRPSHVGIG